MVVVVNTFTYLHTFHESRILSNNKRVEFINIQNTQNIQNNEIYYNTDTVNISYATLENHDLRRVLGEGYTVPSGYSSARSSLWIRIHKWYTVL